MKVSIDPAFIRRINELQKTHERSIKPIEAQIRRFAEQFEQQVQPQMEVLQRAAKSLANLLPTNVPTANLTEAIQLASEDGVGYLWALPRDLVEQLLETDDTSARRLAISGHQLSIAEHCKEELAKRRGPLVELAAETVVLFEEGRLAAAQSLAANLIDSWFSEEYSESDAKNKRSMIASSTEPPDDDELVRIVVANGVCAPLAIAWESWEREDPEILDFSRHQTAHHISNKNTVDDWKCLQALTIASSMACHKSRMM